MRASAHDGHHDCDRSDRDDDRHRNLTSDGRDRDCGHGPIYDDDRHQNHPKSDDDDPHSFQFLPSFRKKIQVACMTNPYHKSH